MFKDISPTDVVKLHEEGSGIMLVDVRSPEEYAEGHASFANNFPLDLISGKQLVDAGIDKTQPIYLICQSGGRSAKACEKLGSEGFDIVYNVTGGTSQWIELGLPISHGSEGDEV